MADPILHSLADELGAVAAAGLAAPPARRFVAVGPDFAHDCDQLVTHFDGIVPGRSTVNSGAMSRTLPREGQVGVEPVATFGVTLVRTCVPKSQVAAGRFLLATPAQHDAVSLPLLTDAFDCWRAVQNAVKAGSLWSTLIEDVRSAGVEVGTLAPHRPGPQGDAVALSFTVSLLLALFTPPAP